MMLGGILFPAVYETVQLFKVGPSLYLSDGSNWMDLFYIWGTILMAIM